MRYITILLIIISSYNGISQTKKYWIKLSDKDGVKINPYSYFDKKAIDRRLKNNIPLVQFSDLPIREDYYNRINSISDSISGKTRWFNAISCWVNVKNIEIIKSLPFVREVVEIKSNKYFASNKEDINAPLFYNDKLIEAQIKSMEGNVFDSLYTGKGIRICVIDAGFPDVDKLDIFKHIRENNRIIKTWDFKKDKPYVYKYNYHGTSVLSCIAGIYKGKKLGMATDAEFLLARTERIHYEGIAEEEDWLEAVEWADKNGADIINSSLGYTQESYFVEDMDGKTSIISKAANMAARKGILVVTAAGNDGNNNWKYVAAPGDADSAFTIGGINPYTGLHTSFSSYGPNSNYKLKPNVSAFGHTIGATSTISMSELTGTSFASPLVTGFAACVWQANKRLTNMEIFKEIEKSSSLYPYYDYAIGYGIPQASYFIKSKTKTSQKPTIIIDTTNNTNIVVTIKDAFFKKTQCAIQQETTRKRNLIHITEENKDKKNVIIKPNVFYYHIENIDGYLDEYKVISVNQKEIVKLNIDKYRGKTLRFHYLGYTEEINL